MRYLRRSTGAVCRGIVCHCLRYSKSTACVTATAKQLEGMRKGPAARGQDVWSYGGACPARKPQPCNPTSSPMDPLQAERASGSRVSTKRFSAVSPSSGRADIAPQTPTESLGSRVLNAAEDRQTVASSSHLSTFYRCPQSAGRQLLTAQQPNWATPGPNSWASWRLLRI
jgi:hypothetical protein